nr:DUF6380 family protein [Streptomyces africanus]
MRSAGAVPRYRTAPRSTSPHARQARHGTAPVFSPARRRGSVGGGSGGCARVTPAVGRGCDAPQACDGTEPMFSLDRCGRVGVAEGAASAPLRDRLDVPVLDAARSAGRRLGRPRRDALHVPLHRGRSLVGSGSGGLAGVTPAARRGSDAPSSPAVGDKWWATLRRGAASLTETVGCPSFGPCGRRAGEGAR